MPRLLPTETLPGEAPVEDALQEYLAAVQASVEASQAFLAAPPGERCAAHAAYREAARRQAAAEQAYERTRQRTHGIPYAGRPRMKLF